MQTIIEGAKTIEEFQKIQMRMAELAEMAYQRHKESFEKWEEGEPVKAWFEDGCEICVEYANGKWWHYKDLELPFPTWW